MPTNGNLCLPIHYNYYIQSAVYNSIDDALATFLHEKGYSLDKRTFKMFTFSRLLGKFSINKNENTIIFAGETKLILSSPIDHFCQSLVNGLLTRGKIRLGEAEVAIERVYLKKPNIKLNQVKLRTLSPIVVYRTDLKEDGRKYTQYLKPGDPEYSTLIGDNLRKKYQAFYKEEPPQGEIQVSPLGRIQEHIIKYKNFIIKGYSGDILLTAPVPLLQLGVDGGIGGKNSQGFGCVEVKE